MCLKSWLLVLLAAFFVAGCVQQEQPEMAEVNLISFEVFPSSATLYQRNRYNNEVDLKVFEGKILQLVHSLDYVCCANISLKFNLTVERGRTILLLSEEDVATGPVDLDSCRMPCGYNVSAFFEPVYPGKYAVRIIGVNTSQSGGKLIVEEAFTVNDRRELEWDYEIGGGFNKFSCRSDADCVKASCCHASDCINRKFSLDCEGIACTQECRPGTFDCGKGFCKCKSSRCGPVFVS